MKALEKAARAAYHVQPRNKPYEALELRFKRYWEKRARAVIASIDVDDAMVEAFVTEMWPQTDSAIFRSYRAKIAAALKAALHSILVDGEGR